MSALGDAIDFDLFSFKDIWKKIEQDPERLFLPLQTADPISTEIMNKTFGKDYEPLTNQVGGPMGSGFFGLGSGGAFDRFEEETGKSKRTPNKVHDIGEVVAGIIGLIYGGAALGAGGAAGGGGGAEAGGTAGGVGKGGGTSGGAPAEGGNFFSGIGDKFNFADMNWQDPNTYMNLQSTFGGQSPSIGQAATPLTAGTTGESEEDRLERQHREALIAQAMQIEQQRQEAQRQQNSIAGVLHA